ncbi:MAG: hypothetical protein ACOVN5_07165 [Aquidulcibacter sp.]
MYVTDMPDDVAGQPDTNAPATDGVEENTSLAERNLVKAKIQTIKRDKLHHDKAFKRMKRDMHVAMWGAEKEWGENNYRANIVGRHIKMKTAALYAKNPKAVAKRREQLDYQIWDENPASLQIAFQTIQQGQMMMQQAQAMQSFLPPDPLTGQVPVMPPQLPPGFAEAQALIADFQQGYARQQMLEKYGKTLEILFANALREQKPLDFKRGMKQVVRRALTAGVGYVELGFQREMGPRPGMTEKLADARARLDHLRNLAEQVGEGEIEANDAEMAELQASVEQLMAEPEIVLREGLILDFPQATKVIPDCRTKYLDGFVGAGHITLEYDYTINEVREIFGVDLSESATKYVAANGSGSVYQAADVMDDEYEWGPSESKKTDIVRVWKMYDKPSGLVYFMADGYHSFLRPPAAPDVFVEDFWPVYPLTFNAVESEEDLFPSSDVSLLMDMQREYNRSRQGLREHRNAARPRWVFSNGAFSDEEDPKALAKLPPLHSLGLNIDAETDIRNVLQVVPVPGVDPNLYETGQLFQDMQLVGGSQEANYGGVAKATATESAIAANSTNSSDGSAIDDLDSFLTVIARAAGQILQKEMSAEKVIEIVGPGAVWPEVSLADIASEMFLEVEAGSSGKPNQAIEIANLQRLLPMLIQIPGIDPVWLAKETIRRLDDRLDVAKAIAAGIPSIVAMNQQRQVATPNGDPNAQGPEGANNAKKPEQQGGSQAAFGSNQTDPVPAQM